MSLQSFNNLNVNGDNPSGPKKESPIRDDNFFGNVDEAAKHALMREQMREDLRQRASVIMPLNSGLFCLLPEHESSLSPFTLFSEHENKIKNNNVSAQFKLFLHDAQERGKIIYFAIFE